MHLREDGALLPDNISPMANCPFLFSKDSARMISNNTVYGTYCLLVTLLIPSRALGGAQEEEVGATLIGHRSM